MSYLIRIEWLSNGSGHRGISTPHNGRWLSSYNPDYFGGLGHIQTTDMPTKAIHFASVEEALAYYRQASRILPRREDGQPNCPLTAYSVTIERYEMN